MDIELFRERTGLGAKQWNGAANASVRLLVSLRQIVKVTSIQMMEKAYLRTLLDKVVLENNPDEYPYKSCEISLGRIDPKFLQVGQTFVENTKCLKILNDLPHVFDQFYITGGFAKLVPMIIHGVTREGVAAVAHYVPPIVEERAGKECLIDGIHRNFLVKAIGTTIESIRIQNVQYPLPFSTHTWDRVSSVDLKPERNDRFNHLKPELFRDLSWVAIDG
jgi:hypothetical protein